MSEQHTAAPAQDENQLIAERREKLKAIRQRQAEGKGPAFPNDFKPADRAADLFAAHAGQTPEGLLAQASRASVAGRMMLKRVMGKASFATLQDSSGRIQIYVKRDEIGEEAYETFKHWDLGDIVAAEGLVFKTKTGELSIQATSVHLLTKSLRPMPDKFHGVADQEVKYRQRYVDLMTDEEARKRFVARSKAVSSIREFMVTHGFLEVETPMLHSIPGGANAKPFITHHNALDQEMFLRIAPELYLKRLIVGGFERVFEINRNFRNEGISVRHNPEFTMMEFYAAYWDYQDLMTYTEGLVRHAAQQATGTLQLSYGGKPVDLAQPFERLTIREAIIRHSEAGSAFVDDSAWLINALKKLGLNEEKNKLSTRSLSSLQVLYFEEVVEEKLWQPTFICEHPVEISPLARASDTRPDVTERFELYITGREFGNGFSELNDAEEQAARFHSQVAAKDSGDDEAMFFDHDFVRALEYGMPPTGGCGIGIDRLMMLLTDSPSIRDVILFPALRREGWTGPAPAVALNYLSGYPQPIQSQVQQLLAQGRLGEMLLGKYRRRHGIRTDRALFSYVQDLKAEFLRSAEPLNKVCFDNKLHVIQHALGTHTSISRVQGSRLKAKREIRIATLFRDVPVAFLKMIAVHELAHLKVQAHDKAFYQLCTHMEPDYHQIEFDLRLYLTYVETSGRLDWPDQPGKA